MSNETKIAILTIVSISMAIFGYKYIRGKNIFKSSNTLYIEYQEVQSLTKSSPVFINGFPIGIVQDVRLKEDMNTIHVTLDIKRGVKIHKNAIAEIISSSIMGGKAIRIINNNPCQEGDCAPSGSYLKGRTVGMMNSLVPQEDMTQYLDFLKENLGEVYDTLNAKLRDPNPNNGIGKTIRDLQGSLANLKSSTDQLNSIMLSSSGKIDRTLGNMEKITTTISSNNDKIENILGNAEKFSTNLSSMDLSATMSKADTTLISANKAVQQLQATLASTDRAVADMTTIMANLKDGKGSIGKLLNDETLYNNLNKTSMRLDTFLADIKEKPYRYMPLKSRRKVKKYDRKDGE